jgi:hypothetical protein
LRYQETKLRDEALPRKAAPFRCRVVIVAKVPIAGRVKTRLAREIGTTRATAFYRIAAGNLIRRLSAVPFWEVVLSISPDSGVRTAMLPGGCARMPQGGGDLGQRMQRPMRTLPPGPVCLVGTDVPDVSVAAIRRAFRALGTNDVVFGPAADGGFWLVGLRRRPRVIDPYRDVPWSSPDTLARSVANLAGAKVAATDTLSDVDGAVDLLRNAGRFARRVRPG